jgi:F-type H+-transporting ATPase subunit b
MAENPTNTITSIDHVPAGERGKNFPPFDKSTFASQLVWFAIFFIALYVIIARLAIPRIGGIIEARRGRVEGDIAEANRLKGQSDQALQAYEKSLADARNRAQALGNEARDKLRAQTEEARKKLEGELNAKLAEAEQAIAGTKAAAMRNVQGIAVETASAIVQQLIGTAPAGSDVETAVAGALKR